MNQPPARHIDIEFVSNLRDLGGYETRDGRTTAWKRLFRSGELRHESLSQVLRLRDEVGLSSVIDLRSLMEIRPEKVAFLKGVEIRYHHVSLEGDNGSPAPEENLFSQFRNMGEFYLFMLRSDVFNRQLIKALEAVADAENHPALFHCTVGKDRTGIVAAFVLDIIGVRDEDIISDYALTMSCMPAFIERMKANEKTAPIVDSLPAFFWEAAPESMEVLLGALRREHGSLRNYLKTRGAGDELFNRLEAALLI